MPDHTWDPMVQLLDGFQMRIGNWQSNPQAATVCNDHVQHAVGYIFQAASMRCITSLTLCTNLSHCGQLRCHPMTVEPHHGIT